MPMTSDEIERLLRQAFPDARTELKDLRAAHEGWLPGYMSA